jgi:hypothetical protein
MNKQPLIRVAQVLALLAVIALPVKASSGNACYRECLDDHHNFCDNFPPDQLGMCSGYVIEMCRCSCYLYCP